MKLPGIPSAPADGPVIDVEGKGKPYMIGTIFNEGEGRYEVLIQFGDFKTLHDAEMFTHLIAPKVKAWAGGRQERAKQETAS